MPRYTDDWLFDDLDDAPTTPEEASAHYEFVHGDEVQFVKELQDHIGREGFLSPVE
jgi:hypothetical protein